MNNKLLVKLYVRLLQQMFCLFCEVAINQCQNIFFVKLCTQSDSVIHQQPVASLVDEEKKRVSEAARRAKTCRKLELDFSY